ncbi:hypothetical protein RQP46_005649 [Phenoliferia psychrophenolica]
MQNDGMQTINVQLSLPVGRSVNVNLVVTCRPDGVVHVSTSSSAGSAQTTESVLSSSLEEAPRDMRNMLIESISADLFEAATSRGVREYLVSLASVALAPELVAYGLWERLVRLIAGDGDFVDVELEGQLRFLATLCPSATSGVGDDGVDLWRRTTIDHILETGVQPQHRWDDFIHSVMERSGYLLLDHGLDERKLCGLPQYQNQGIEHGGMSTPPQMRTDAMQTINLKLALPVGKSVSVNLTVTCSYEEQIALPATVGTFVFPDLDNEGSEAPTERSTVSLFNESRSATPVPEGGSNPGRDGAHTLAAEPVFQVRTFACIAN